MVRERGLRQITTLSCQLTKVCPNVSVSELPDPLTMQQVIEFTDYHSKVSVRRVDVAERLG